MGRSILIIDDDEVLRTRLARACVARGLAASAVGDAAAALELVMHADFDFAIVDLRMPGMPGLELVQRLKHVAPRLKVVVLTGYGSIANAVEAMRLGAVNYLTKPADADQMLAAFSPAGATPVPERHAVAPSLARAEWEHINQVLTTCHGNVSEAARRLGLHRRTLQRKLQKYPPRR